MKGTYAVAAMVRNLQQAHTAFIRAGEVTGPRERHRARRGLVRQTGQIGHAESWCGAKGTQDEAHAALIKAGKHQRDEEGHFTCRVHAKGWWGNDSTQRHTPPWSGQVRRAVLSTRRNAEGLGLSVTCREHAKGWWGDESTQRHTPPWSGQVRRAVHRVCRARKGW